MAALARNNRPSTSAQSLQDVLRQLPPDVMEDNLWDQLPRRSKCSLRQASLPCRLLAELLVTDVTLHDHRCILGARAIPKRNPWLARQLTDEEVEPWHLAAQSRALYLARLPRLTSLKLTDWPGEAALLTLLTKYGAATAGRLSRLALRGGSHVTIASTCAIRLACPALTELDLCCTDAKAGADGALVGDLLGPLQDVPLLSLTMAGSGRIALHSLRSLGGLSHLRHLRLNVPGLLPHHLLPLAGLSNLASLSFGLSVDDVSTGPLTRLSFLDIHPLRTLSRLTRLELLSLDYDAPAAPEGAAAAAQRLAAGVAVLACLAQLERLVLNPDFAVDDLVFGALRQLTRLTWLQVASIHLTQPTPGHLPRLRHLHLSSRLQPSALLRTLLPLLPLPALQTLCPLEEPFELLATYDSGSDDDDDDNSNDDDDNDGSDVTKAARQAADLRTACQHLAAAPLLALRSLALCCDGDSPLPCGRLMQGLQPLAQHLTSLSLDMRAMLGAEFGVLSACLPNLQSLSLGFCGVTDGALPAVLSRWPSLARVGVSHCTGLTSEGWLALAALRAAPLVVDVEPPLPRALRRQCRALQARLFGRQNMTFE